MKDDKARDFFSAYLEGTLEPGLRASLDRRLTTDDVLRAEYEAFAATVASLDEMRFEAIEVPMYLSDRIATRLENARETKRPPFWAAWLAPRSTYALGLASTLLVAAFGLQTMRAEGTGRAGVLPFSSDSLRWTAADGSFVATFSGGEARTVTVVPEGGEAQKLSVAGGQNLELALRNPNRTAKRFRISQGDDLLATVALPGARPTIRRTGSGTITELASALADNFNVPVVVKSATPGTTVRWNFDGVDAFKAAQKSLEGVDGATPSDMASGVLLIGQ